MTEELKKKEAVTSSNNDGEYMLGPVPASARRSTVSQIMVWIGFGYAVTGLIVGGNLAGYGMPAGMPPMKAFLTIAIGMGLLYVMTCLTGMAAQKTGYNLGLLTRYSYGEKGAVLPLAIMSLLTLGWFASIAGMVGEVWSEWIGNPSGVIVINPANFGMEGIDPITLEEFLACAISGIIFTYTAVRGMGAIEKVATVFSPLILIVAVIAGFTFMKQSGGVGPFMDKASQLDGLGVGSGITIVVGSWIAGAIMGVDMFRFNKTTRDVWICAAFCFIITNPILNFVGYIGVVATGEYNYVFAMIGAGIILAILGVVVWTTALWTTDNTELYCNSMYTGPALESLGIVVERKKIVIVVGVVGTILGAAAFYQLFFATFINVLGSMAPPLIAPILADFFVVGKEKKYDKSALDKQPAIRWAGIISFVVGAFLGWFFQYQAVLPYGLPAGVFGLIVAFFVYVTIYKLTPDAKADAEILAKLK